MALPTSALRRLQPNNMMRRPDQMSQGAQQAMGVNNLSQQALSGQGQMMDANQQRPQLGGYQPPPMMQSGAAPQQPTMQTMQQPQ